MKTPYVIPVKGPFSARWEVGGELFEDSEVLGADLVVAVNVGEVIRMEIDGTVVVACDRCLEDCPLPVQVSETLAEEDLEVEGGEADLGQYIYESVVLALPMQRVHPDDVLGRPMCRPDMLERFKIVSEEEFNT